MKILNFFNGIFFSIGYFALSQDYFRHVDPVVMAVHVALVVLPLFTLVASHFIKESKTP